jgi:hypothetical protein
MEYGFAEVYVGYCIYLQFSCLSQLCVDSACFDVEAHVI